AEQRRLTGDRARAGRAFPRRRQRAGPGRPRNGRVAVRIAGAVDAGHAAASDRYGGRARHARSRAALQGARAVRIGHDASAAFDALLAEEAGAAERDRPGEDLIADVAVAVGNRRQRRATAGGAVDLVDQVDARAGHGGVVPHLAGRDVLLDGGDVVRL